ncbi:MAG: 3-deoxy-manno-octulosonate cytidylyltransferase [Candidatus Hydrogenedentes bacterium]|nr:3-deoxy-manno-octulosonate cytidylyltransferase [Candidatus Hydrogenedentota bacterium]
MHDVKVVGIIPARYASSRRPGKPLAQIAGKSMIQRVYEQCSASTLLQSVCVATDDRRIEDAVAAFGGHAVMTRADHPSGTDRVAEAAEQLGADIVVNIQGDQPFIDPSMIDEAVAPLLREGAADVSTLMFPLTHEEDLRNPSVVKVVVTLAGNALYFSRSLIPYPREAVPHTVYEHVGLYVYRKDTLMRLTRLPSTTLEKVESLEQLRWLEHGLRIQVTESAVPDKAFHGFSIDTQEDFERAEQMLRERAG